MQNGHVESFNRCLRDECLNHNWFTTLADAYRTPDEYAEACSRLANRMGGSAIPPSRPSAESESQNGLNGHLKSGQWWTPGIRPTESGEQY
jgi:hypothetical protein